MNKDKLAEQLALAKQAGTRAMAKDFFAPTPGTESPEGSPQEEASESPSEAKAEGDAHGGGAPGGTPGGGDLGGLTPQQLEELMQMLQSQGGGGQ